MKGAFFLVIDCNRESSFEPGLIQSELKTPYSVKIELCVFPLLFHVSCHFLHICL
jgi:hypothetical protein